MNDRMQKQKNEFDALSELIRAYEALPPIVDDDYPEMRHKYEAKLRAFRVALENNRSKIDDRQEEIKVTGSRAEIASYQSIPHISVISFQRALRWHGHGLESWSESDWYTALAGEAGECFEAVLKMGDTIKKRNRLRDNVDSQNNPKADELKTKLKMEIGDVYIYLDLLARRVGLNLEDCVRDTFNRVSDREGFPERL